MMMSTRVFLILSVLLLVHGAPMDALLNPTRNNQTPKEAKIWETPTAPDSGQTSREASSPPLSSYSAQSIHSTNTNQSPLAESTSEHVATTCVLKTGTWYLLLEPKDSIHELGQSKVSMVADGIFFTQDNTIFVPKGTTIEPSNDISFKLPSGDTKIEIMDKSDSRLAKVGIFPEGSTYYRKKQPHKSRELNPIVLKTAAMIIITPNREIFHLKKDTIVIVLPGILRLPPGEKNQEITKKDQDRIEAWCTSIYTGKEDMKYKFDGFCFEVNLWFVWGPKFITPRQNDIDKLFSHHRRRTMFNGP